MQLNIPTIGDAFVLAEDWTFHLERESRNDALTKHTPWFKKWGHLRHESWTKFHLALEDATPEDYLVTLPAGTVLKVERIYIRSSFRGFDSVTFRANPNDRKATHRGRFFAKLADVNKAVFQ